MAFDKERLRAILGDDASDDLLNDILKAHSQSVSQDKGRIDRLTADLDGYRAKEAEWEQQRQASLTDQERLQEALDAASKAQADFNRKSARLDAEQVLVAAGLTQEQYAPLIESMVSEDSERSVANANALVALVQARAKAASDAAVAKVLSNTPKPAPGDEGGASAPTTISEFLALPYEEQLSLKNADPSILSKLSAAGK